MKGFCILSKILLIILSFLCISLNTIDAKVTWNYVKSPKYKTELKAEYKKIPLKAREVFNDNDLLIKIYGNNHFKNWAGLFNGDVIIESFNVSWLRSFFSRRGVRTPYSDKKISMDYAKCNLIHELGHAFDYNSDRLSHTKEFKNIYKKEKNKFTSTSYYAYPMGKVKENINNVEEYFASTFTVYVRLRADLKKHCPKTYNYFKKLFEKED